MSIWEIDFDHPIKQLEQNKQVETLIIGAGMTGMTLAYYLKEQDICVIDASFIGHGVTLNTTAKINYFQERNYTKIKKMLGEEKAISYLNSQIEAKELLRAIIEKEKIACDFKQVPSYVYARTKEEKKRLKEEAQFLQKHHGKIVRQKEKGKTFYRVEDTYIFHPLKYLKGLYQILTQNHIPIYEKSPIVKIEKKNQGYICYTEKFSIQANRIVLACHYPYFLIPFFIPLKTSIEKSYIVVTKTKEKKDYTYISSSNPTYSSRFYETKQEKYQIFLAESHCIATKQNDEKHFQKLKEHFHIREKDVLMEYSNVDIKTPDFLPYIGKIKENMYLSTGYNTWGMTNSVLGAKIISDQLNSVENSFSHLVDPKRKNWILYAKIPYHIALQTKAYLGPKIKKKKSWYSKRISFIGEKAVYIDLQGNQHVVYNKCPHLGCSLIFNEVEKTWDCSCHSSRFTIDGACIKGPSIWDIMYPKEKEK